MTSSSALALIAPLLFFAGQAAKESFCDVSVTANRGVAGYWLRPRLRHFLICIINSSELDSSVSFIIILPSFIVARVLESVLLWLRVFWNGPSV